MNLLDMTAVALYIVAITVASLVDGEQKMWRLLPLCLAVMANEAAGKCVSAAQVFFTVAMIVLVAADGAQKAWCVIPMLLSLSYMLWSFSCSKPKGSYAGEYVTAPVVDFTTPSKPLPDGADDLL